MGIWFIVKHKTSVKFNYPIKFKANTRLILAKNSEIFRLTRPINIPIHRPLDLRPVCLPNSSLLNLYLFDKYLFKTLSLFYIWSLSQPLLTLSLVGSLKSRKPKTLLKNFKEYNLEYYLLQNSLTIDDLSSSKNYEINLNNQTALRIINFF
jgi:hypothetical protein